MDKPVFMIGWEFPPHNSGGLGVACQGIARGLQQIGQPLVFALPQQLPSGGSYRKVRTNADFVSSSVKKDKSAASRSVDRLTTAEQAGELSELEMILVNSNLEPYWRQSKFTGFSSGDIVAESHRYGRVVAEVAASDYPEAKLFHAHDWMSVPAGLAARQKMKKPLVLHIHSTEFDRAGGGQPNQEIAEVEWQGLTKADKIVTVSHYTKQLIVNKYNIPADKIEVIYNGIDPNPDYHNQPLAKFLADRPVIVFVGRLTIQKGPEYFLAVAKKVIEQNKKAIFVLAGQGDMYQSLLVSSAYQGLSGSVLFAGFLRGKEKQMLYQRADVFVMPSVSEPFGIAALEAALEKTPVIVSKNSGVSEVLPKAYAVDFWDINKMSSQIIELIEKPQKRHQVGEDVYRQASALSWRAVAQQLKHLYEEIL